METYDRGFRLKKLRKARKLTQQQVAERLEVTASIISAYECNTSAPSIETLEQLAILYRASTDYILGLDHRKCIFIDDLTESQQKTVEGMVELLRAEFQKKDVKFIQR